MSPADNVERLDPFNRGPAEIPEAQRRAIDSAYSAAKASGALDRAADARVLREQAQFEAADSQWGLA